MTANEFPSIEEGTREAMKLERQCVLPELILHPETTNVSTEPIGRAEDKGFSTTIQGTIDSNSNDTDKGLSFSRVSPTCVVAEWEDEDDADNLPQFQVTQQQQQQVSDEIVALRQALEEAQSRRMRIQENLKQKRVRVQSLEKELATATVATAESRAMVKDLETQKASLRDGLARLSVSRDIFKSRWKDQIQVNKELHEQLAVEQARWRREEARQAKELQLLDLYRKLSKLTGYQQMGKDIRNLEAELAAWPAK